jgi:hypothetical protein
MVNSHRRGIWYVLLGLTRLVSRHFNRCDVTLIFLPKNKQKVATMTENTAIPVIRLDDPDQEATVKKLRDACVNVGFFYLSGHGISDELLSDVMEQSKRLFDLPLSSKQALSDKVMSRGYTAMEEETLDPANQTRGDTKEGKIKLRCEQRRVAQRRSFLRTEEKSRRIITTLVVGKYLL